MGGVTMKKVTQIFAVLLILTTGSRIPAQSGDFSAGVFTTLQNYQRNSMLSQINDPVGFGIVLQYNLHTNIALQASGVHTRGNHENRNGTETNVQAKGAMLYYPLETGIIRPYFMGGFGYMSISRNLNNVGKKNGSNIYSEYGLGADINVLNQVNLNINLVFYNDGLGFAGYGSSLGFRYSL
jgi:hypothetical protein